jgi:aryl-alcohol dehydrogenase-like predicted oxidoreductase
MPAEIPPPCDDERVDTIEWSPLARGRLARDSGARWAKGQPYSGPRTPGAMGLSILGEQTWSEWRATVTG